MSRRLSAFDLLNEMGLAQHHAASIPGPAAWLIARNWLPDIEEAKAALNKPGFDTETGEFIRAQTLCAIDAIRQRGQEWADAQEPTRTPPIPVQGDSEVVKEPMTRTEAARLLAVSKERVGQLIRKGAIHATKANGEWQIDRASVEARAEGSSQ